MSITLRPAIVSAPPHRRQLVQVPVLAAATQAARKAKEQWGKLTDDDIEVVAGRRGQLVGKIQERYGVARDEAEKQLSECHAWRAAGREEKYLEAYFMVEALELQLDERLRRNPAHKPHG